MATYKIIRGESETSTGRIVTVWHVADASDGYIYDTFGLRRDAKAWIDRATKAA